MLNAAVLFFGGIVELLVNCSLFLWHIKGVKRKVFPSLTNKNKMAHHLSPVKI